MFFIDEFIGEREVHKLQKHFTSMESPHLRIRADVAGHFRPVSCSPVL